MERPETQQTFERFLQMAGGALVFGVIGVADELGLFRAMAGAGPLTSAALAERCNADERYLDEILAALAGVGTVQYDPAARTWTLPDTAAACLADESSPFFVAGWPQLLRGLYGAMPDVVGACRTGGGVPYEAYGESFVRGLDRWEGPVTRAFLVDRWLAAMPDVVERLRAGGRVADVGCATGFGATTVASAFPAAEVIGYDLDETSLARAREAGAGIPNVSFERCDIREMPTEPGFDLILALRTAHDLSYPVPCFQRMRAALAPGGSVFLIEPPGFDRAEDGLSPMAAGRFAISLLHCLPVSRMDGGSGHGARFGPQAVARLAEQSGFQHVERLQLGGGGDGFYRLR